MAQVRRDEDASLVNLFHQLKPEDGLIRLFQRGDNEWGAIGSDAERVAQLVYHTTSALRKIGNSQLPFCSMNGTLFRTFLAEVLQKHALRVEIYESESGSKSRWKPAKHASPGNLQAVEEYLGNSSDESPVVCSIVYSGASEKVVGICFIDAEARLLGLGQFNDNDLFSNLESMLIQLGTKEALIVDDSKTGNTDAKKLNAVLDKLDILVTKRRSSQFSSTDVDQDLIRLTGRSNLELARELNMDKALGAAGAVIKYLGLMATPENFGAYTVKEHSLSQYMKLDAAAIKALTLMPTARDGSKTMSIFGLLNQCKTVAGSRMLSQWLKQPLMDIQAIKCRHDLVETFINDPISRSRLQDDCFINVPDISKIARKFHTGKAKLEDIVRLYQLVINLPQFIEVLNPLGDACRETYALKLEDASNNLVKLIELVETCVDLQALQNHEYVVKADFDEQLQSIRSDMSESWEGMEQCLQDTIDDLGTDKVKMENNNSYGWSFRLTRTDAGCLRGRKNYIDLGTQKAGQYFTTRSMRTHANTYMEANENYRKAQQSVAREVVNVASTYLPVLVPLGETLAHLDVIISFAQVSAFAKLPYVRPNISESGDIILKAARHPCMEVQPDMMFIPNDVSMKRDSSEFSIITGPNMGGKSTYIRQIGVISHLAQIGCFVPCEEAQLPIVDCILARVGAGDSQLKGISTFMAEMLETASILKTATSRSLIVIDELGRGTSTYDGFGLAWAISKHIVENIRCFCVFATHFHELTSLSNDHPTVANLQVVANASASQDDITLLYKVKPGISDKSFGIHVAEVVNFPEKVVRMAKRKATELEEELVDMHSTVSHYDETGVQSLRSFLKEWATSAPKDNPELALQQLRALYDSKRSKLESHPYIKKVLTTL